MKTENLPVDVRVPFGLALERLGDVRNLTRSCRLLLDVADCEGIPERILEMARDALETAEGSVGCVLECVGEARGAELHGDAALTVARVAGHVVSGAFRELLWEGCFDGRSPLVGDPQACHDVLEAHAVAAVPVLEGVLSALDSALYMLGRALKLEDVPPVPPDIDVY
jgi:hypothetical protein